MALTVFNCFKKALCTYPVLHSLLPGTVYMDASDVGLGIVLAQQKRQGQWSIFLFYHKLSAAEQKYAMIEKLLPCAWPLKNYLWEQCFEVVTDRAPLQWLV